MAIDDKMANRQIQEFSGSPMDDDKSLGKFSGRLKSRSGWR